MPSKYLRRPVVEELSGLSRSTIYDLMSRGEFPRPIKLTSKSVAWSEEEVLDWLASRPKSKGRA
jgi:prophage regulatory protein